MIEVSIPIEVTLRNFLDQWFQENGYDYPVYLETESSMPDEYVMLEKTSSGKSNHICDATFAVQSISTSMAKAAELNELSKCAMEQSINTDRITRCELDTDYPWTDTETKSYRYQAVFNLTHYC